MKPIFDENGLATEPGEIRCYYYDAATSEYIGWSDEYINLGVSMPGHSTDIDPGEDVPDEVAVFGGKEWSWQEYHRGETVFSTADGSRVTIDYIGEIRDGFTTSEPGTPYDKWDGSQWVTDTVAQHAANVATAEGEKLSRTDQANDYMNKKQWPGKAALGRLTETEKEQYNLWLDYLDALESVDISSAPDINWPESPEV